MTLNDLEAPF